MCLNAIALFLCLCYFFVARMLFGTESNFGVIAFSCLNVSGCFTFSTISTYWVIRKYQKQLELPNLVSNTSFELLSLDQVLSTKDGFDLMADWLVRECLVSLHCLFQMLIFPHAVSIENLFFLFEVVQIKNQMLQKQLINVEDIGVTINIEANLLKTLRRADGDINNIEDFTRSLKYVMNQYIEYGSEFCINISADTRSKIHSDFDKISVRSPDITTQGTEAKFFSPYQKAENPKNFDNIPDKEGNDPPVEPQKISGEYIQIFDQAMDEVVSLLQTDSLTRFSQTADYKKLANDIK